VLKITDRAEHWYTRTRAAWRTDVARGALPSDARVRWVSWPGSCRLSRTCVRALVVYPIHERKNTHAAQCTGNWLHVTRDHCVALFSPGIQFSLFHSPSLSRRILSLLLLFDFFLIFDFLVPLTLLASLRGRAGHVDRKGETAKTREPIRAHRWRPTGRRVVLGRDVFRFTSRGGGAELLKFRLQFGLKVYQLNFWWYLHQVNP
jgi:hypothetical protein